MTDRSWCDTCRDVQARYEHSQATLARVRGALQGLYDATADYIAVNHLGDIHHNSVMANARAALEGRDA